ncbi:MAG TPA: hypothetical protein VF535_12135 [Allosphingosinicella sp.]
MKFFVPWASDDDHAEQIWADSRSDLAELGMPTTKRRIWALSLDRTRPHCLLHIGREVPDGCGPAMLILEASNLDIYYVCTPWNGVLGGEPFPMGLSKRGRAIDFDEVIEGNA